jgi:hypothetical protein
VELTTSRADPAHHGAQATAQPGHAAQPAGHRLQRGTQLGGQLAAHLLRVGADHATQGVHGLLGDRVTQRGPYRQRGLDTFGPAPGLRGTDAAGERRGLIQPQVRQLDRLDDLLAVGIQHARIALGRDCLPGHVLGQVPVDRAALPGHKVGELPQGVRKLLRVAQRSERITARIVTGAATGFTGATPAARTPGTAGQTKAEGRISHLRDLSGRMEGSQPPRYLGSGTR